MNNRHAYLRQVWHFAAFLAAALFLYCGAASPALAQSTMPRPPIVKTELLVDAPRLNAGDTVWAGVAFTLPPGWHIYAKDPGDSGIPTSYAWRLPDGISAGDIQWPKPETITLAGFTNYGYSRYVILPVPLTVSAPLREANITVKTSWLACADTCIPESATLTATLPFHDAETARKLVQAAMPDSAVTLSEVLNPLVLLFAFLGGLLLNIMPCVLPILSLKALTLVKKSQSAPHRARAHGLAYTLGVVGSFLLIACVLLALRATGAAIGWGFQLQSPLFVGALLMLMLAVSANLAGWFQVPVLLGGIRTDTENLRGTALTGALAVAVATPCTAPFMASAVGATLLLPMAHALLVFAVMGLGMAAPFLLISYWPAALRLLPKPGAWMHRFKQWLAIPMALTALWLALVLLQLLATPKEADRALRDSYTIVHVEPYTPAALAALRAAHTPVLIDATAAWCLTCQVNARVALKPLRTQEFLRDHNVTLMVADWTARNPDITALLAEFGRNGVPLMVFYPPYGEPVVLPQILIPGTVITTVRDALGLNR